MSRKVQCASYNYEKNEWAELDVSANFKVYPCCGYHGYYETHEWDDDRFKLLAPDWNDLRKNNIETIKKTMFAILNVENFDSGNCPRMCRATCGIDISERLMPTRTKQKID